MIDFMNFLAQGDPTGGGAGITIGATTAGVIAGILGKHFLLSGGANKKVTAKHDHNGIYVRKDLCIERHKRTDETLNRIEVKVDEILKK